MQRRLRRLCVTWLQCGSFILTIILLTDRLLPDNGSEVVTMQPFRSPGNHTVVNKVIHVDTDDFPFKVIYTDSSSDDENQPDYDSYSTFKAQERGPTREAFVQDVFLFSAVVGNSSASWDKIVVNVWEHKKYDGVTFACCIKYRTGVIVRVNATLKVDWSYKGRCKMPVKQYYCPNPRSHLADDPTRVSIIGEGSCNDTERFYVEPVYAYAHPESIGVCTKLVYGNISADDVMTWLEVHRRLGASKISIHTYDLNAAALRVLQYYRSKGLVEFSPFGIPDSPHWVNNGRGHVARLVGGKNFQTWNDEQILIYTCLEKLKGYKYLVVLDIDEYIVPKHNLKWSELFENLWSEKPRAAGFTFLVQLHVTSWGVTNGSAEFTIGRYLNSTEAMSDRTKHVTRPDRLADGGLSTHQFYPLWSKDYHRYVAKKTDAVIHHYRECRKDWKRRNNITCVDMDRFSDPTVADMLGPIEKELLDLRYLIHSQEKQL